MMRSVGITDEGARLLAGAVVGRSVEDYRKLKKGKRPLVKVDGAWMERDSNMSAISYFLKEDGGAQEYLDLARINITPSAILRRL